MSRFDECRAWLAPPECDGDRSDSDVLWRWSPERDALVWADGSTVMMTAELARWVALVAARGEGLPHLDAIVVVVGATRSPARAARWGDFSAAHEVWQAVRRDADTRLAFVDWSLAALPVGDDPNLAEALVDVLENGPSASAMGPPRAPLRPQAIAPLALRGLQGVTPERVTRLARTGVADAPRPVDLEWSDFMGRLERESRTQRIAAVARGVSASMRLPRLTARRPMQASGGTAGFTNRGSLERLAISELAHDADVLALRLAMGEALFTEPAPPPETPDTARRIVVDGGVSTWGVARHVLIGAAVAFARRDDTLTGPIVSGTVIGPRWIATDLRSPEGIEGHLELLDRALDLRAALPGCVEAHPRDDWVICVALDTATDPAFRVAMPHGPGRRFVVGAGEDGRCCMWAVGPNGWRLERDVSIDAGRLQLSPTPKREPAMLGLKMAPFPPGHYGDRVVGVFVYDGSFAIAYRRRGLQLRLSRARNACFQRTESEGVIALGAVEGGPRRRCALPGGIAVWLVDGIFHLVAADDEVSLRFDPSGRPLEGWSPNGGRLTGPELVERVRRLIVGCG